MSDTFTGHPIAMHAANIVVAAPVVLWFAGEFQGIVATLAACAALVVYSLEIYDWYQRRKARRATEKSPRAD